MASAIRPVSPAAARPFARSRPTRLTETASYSRCREAASRAHPAVAQIALSVRRRIAEAVLRRDGPVCDAKRRGGGHEEAQTRYWRLPRHPARHDPDREDRRFARPGLRRAVSLWDRRRLEPG